MKHLVIKNFIKKNIGAFNRKFKHSKSAIFVGPTLNGIQFLFVVKNLLSMSGKRGTKSWSKKQHASTYPEYLFWYKTSLNTFYV